MERIRLILSNGEEKIFSPEWSVKQGKEAIELLEREKFFETEERTEYGKIIQVAIKILSITSGLSEKEIEEGVRYKDLLNLCFEIFEANGIIPSETKEPIFEKKT
jgi:hypothetical protein